MRARTSSFTPAARRDGLKLYFEALLLLLLAAGFAALVGTGFFGAGIIAVGAGALLLRGLFLWRGYQPRIPAHWITAITLLYILFYGVDYYLLGSSFLTATAHLVLFVAVVKLFTASAPRDYLYLCVLAFLEILTATTLTVAAGFFFFLVVFILLLVATFVAYEMFRAGQAAAPGQAAAYPARRLRTSLAGISLAMAAGIVVLAAGLFFILPRLSYRYWNPMLARTGISGFSNQVRLGAVSRLQRDPQVLLHIRLLGPRAHGRAMRRLARHIYWRGRALSTFNGRSWFDPARPRVLRSAFGRVEFPPSFYPGRPSRLLQYRIVMAPLGTGVLFLAPGVRLILTSFPDLSDDATQTITSLGASAGGASYTAVSDIGQPAPAQLRLAGRHIPAAIRRRDLQLPPHLDPRLPVLARAIVAHVPRDAWDRMRALQLYLRAHEHYTLTGLPGGRDPLANFLFRAHAGDCEYFASALAILGRLDGVPTRVVNGFVTGPYNRYSGEFLVRGEDAHSWVEAYFPPPAPAGSRGLASASAWRAWLTPGLGRASLGAWVGFDATPPGAVPSLHGPWARAMLLLDAAQTFWQDWVVNYDFFHQVRLARALRQGWRVRLRASRNWLRAVWNQFTGRGRKIPIAIQLAPRHPRRTVAVILVLGFCLTLLGYGLRRRRNLARTHSLTPGQQLAIRSWRRAHAWLRSAGYARAPAQTPMEMAEQLQPSELRRAYLELAGVYEACRFGGAAEGGMAAPAPRLRQNLRALRQALRVAKTAAHPPRL